MRKLALWTAGGFGLAVACGLAGMAHLSATLFTLTVFCAAWMGTAAYIAVRRTAEERR